MPFDGILALGRVNPAERAGTVLHDRAGAESFPAPPTASANCTAQVSRHMWQSLYPGTPVDKVPIGHITNGIHLLGWMKGSVRQFWRNKLTNGDDNGRRNCCREKFGARLGRGRQFTPSSGKKWPTRHLFPTRNSGRCVTGCAAN